MATILPAAPMIGAPPGFNGQRTDIWRGLLYLPPGDGHGPRVRPARLDTIRVERDGRRGLGTRHSVRRVLVLTGAPRIPAHLNELRQASWPRFDVQEGDDGAPSYSVVERTRLTRPGRNLEDIDREFSVSRVPKTATVARRCTDCGRFEPCPCDCR